VAPSPRVVVRCDVCGERREVSERQARRLTCCPYCRWPAKVQVRPRHLQWWKERFTSAEIRELAEGLFADLPVRDPAHPRSAEGGHPASPVGGRPSVMLLARRHGG
jgi:hypothetical protein